MEKSRGLRCDACNDTRVHAYDEHHMTWCKKCCTHEDGYYLVNTDHFGEHLIGQWLCKKCGWVRKGLNHGD